MKQINIQSRIVLIKQISIQSRIVLTKQISIQSRIVQIIKILSNSHFKPYSITYNITDVQRRPP